MDKKLQKLEFIRDGFWNRFTKTGSIYDYGRYRGAKTLVDERRAELDEENQRKI